MKKDKKDKGKREIYCDISFLMKQSGKGGCSGCQRSRKCEEWNHDQIKRNSNIKHSSSSIVLHNYVDKEE